MAYTRDQLRTALLNADRAGDTAAAQRIADEIRAMDSAPQSTGLADTIRNTTAGVATNARNAPKRPHVPDALDAPVVAGISTRQARDLLIGGGQFVSNLAHVASDPLNRMTYGIQRGDKINRQDYQTANDAAAWLTDKTGGNPSEGWRTAGQVATSMRLPIPAGPVGRGVPQALGRGAMRAITGAAAGAGVRDVSPGSLGPNAAMGAATNVLLPPAISALAATRPAKWAGGQLANAFRAGQRALGAPVSAPRLPAHAAPAPPAAILGGRAAQARSARLASAGVRAPTTGMVTRDPAVWTAERELAKRAEGAPVQQAYRAAYGDVADNAQGIVRDLGGAPGKEGAGIASQRVLDAKNTMLQEEITDLYKAVRHEVGDVRIPTLENLRAAQSHPEWWGNAEFDDIAAQINQRLAKMADADGGAAGLSIKQADELRKFIGHLGKDGNQAFAIRRIFKDALDTDVLDNFGGAPFATARAAAHARFSEFEKALVGDVAGGKVAPERLTTRLMSPATPLKDVRRFNQSLGEGTGDAGEAARQALEAQLVDDLFSKGISREGDNVTLTPKTMVNAFEQNAPRYRELMRPETYKQVRRTVYAARDVASDPALSYVNHSNTASAAANGPLGAMFAPAAGPTRAQRIVRPLIGSTAGAMAGGLLGGGLGGAVVGGAAGGAATTAFDEYLARKAAEYASGQAQRAVSPGLAASNITEQLTAAHAAERNRQLRMMIQHLTGDIPVSGALGSASIKHAPRR